MNQHQREPVKHTCPDIDRYIKYIKAAIVEDRDLKYLKEDDLRNAASSMASELYDCIGYLEELRKSNNELRGWGIEEAERVDELEYKIEEEANS